MSNTAISSAALTEASAWRRTCTQPSIIQHQPSNRSKTKAAKPIQRTKLAPAQTPHNRITNTAIDRVCFVIQTTLHPTPATLAYVPQLPMRTGFEERPGGRESATVVGGGMSIVKHLWHLLQVDRISHTRRNHQRDLNMALSALRTCPLWRRSSFQIQRELVRALIRVHYGRFMKFLTTQCGVSRKKLDGEAFVDNSLSAWLAEMKVWEEKWSEKGGENTMRPGSTRSQKGKDEKRDCSVNVKGVIMEGPKDETVDGKNSRNEIFGGRHDVYFSQKKDVTMKTTLRRMAFFISFWALIIMLRWEDVKHWWVVYWAWHADFSARLQV